MNKYRFIYWVGSIFTECFITAKDEEDAIEKFKKRKGEKYIKKIERIDG